MAVRLGRFGSPVNARSLRSAYSGKRVVVTGHTGFKGSWLTQWLLELGADVTGISLRPDTTPSIFTELSLSDRVIHHVLDIRDGDRLQAAIIEADPDYVFHLAAQPIVRASYDDPIGTFATNLMGTVHVLDAVRGLAVQGGPDRPCAVVLATTDKVYQNNEWLFSYRESDRLGGKDPYSASKAAAELAIEGYRQSFFSSSTASGTDQRPTQVASVRAGNVIGGGDWAPDRIVPDIARALASGMPTELRNPRATRPWQHVLDPLHGYLVLGDLLYDSMRQGNDPMVCEYATAFNFGPDLDSVVEVEVLARMFMEHWPGDLVVPDQEEVMRSIDKIKKPEAGRLSVSSERARHLLGWRPRWAVEQAIERTALWYRRYYSGVPAAQLVSDDISAFVEGLPSERLSGLGD